MSFLTELRRRNVFRVAATYVVASWLIIQVVTSISAPLNFPDWFEAAVIVLLIIGFPIAILMAWAFELTPDGIKATSASDVTSGGPTWRALDTALLLGLIGVAAAVIWSRTSVDIDRVDPSSYGVLDKSVAVLPFSDMSPEGNQAYFGDGIAEELLNELTRLEGLRVASRSSSFAYRGRDQDVRDIAEALNVSTILEGSVRKSGDRIRVTAQLINSADGYHLWSETFERELSDIFAIQDEIAEAVSAALGVRLGVGNVNAFRGAGTTSIDAYETYLRGIGTSFFTPSGERIRLLERAVALDGNYAAAWAALGLAIASTMWISPVDDAPNILDRAIPNLRKAVELAPNSSYSFRLLATVHYATLDWINSEEYYSKAMAIHRDGAVLSSYSNFLMRAGRSSESLSYAQQAAAERNSSGNPIRFNAALALGQNEHLHDSGMKPLGPARLEFTRLLLALNGSDPTAVREALQAMPPNDVVTAMFFEPVLRAVDSPEQVITTLKSIYANSELEWPSKHHDVALLAAYFGDPEFALDAIGHEARLTTIRYGVLWYPVMAEMRKLPAFKELVTDVNLVKYWRRYGWSDHCRPLGADDFECF